MTPTPFARALTIAMSLFSLHASALEIEPYSPERLARLQAAGGPVFLHFHADWCPVCKAQTQVFAGWQGKAEVPGTLLRVDYDREKPLRRSLGVRTQSTLISYRGSSEKARIAGETEAAALRATLDAAGR